MATREPTNSRRVALKLALTASALCLLNEVYPATGVAAGESPIPHPPAVSKDIHPVIAIAGVHDTPNDGGSNRLVLAGRHFSELGVKNVTAINPSEDFLEALAGKFPITYRSYTSDNSYDPAKLKGLFLKIAGLNLQRPIIQHINEPNIKTSGARNDPLKLIRESFMAGARQIVEQGGMAMFPPLAQDTRSGSRVHQYYEAMLEELPRHASSEWLRENLVLGVHNYIMDSRRFVQNRDSADIWNWPRFLSRGFQEKIGFKPPLYITEAGSYRYVGDRVSDAEAVMALEKFLLSSLPNDLDIRTVDIWLYSNLAQRPENHALQAHGLEFRQFELASLYRRTESGDKTTPSYHRWAELTQKMKF